MATLSELANAGHIERIEVELEDGELSWRCLYGSPAFVIWLRDVLPSLKTGVMTADLTPAQQVDARFHEFIIGEPFISDRRFKPLHRTPDLFVWELKTIDIRIFGWFAKMDHFVCTFGELKDVLLAMDNVQTFIAKTSFFRQNLDLDEPKTIEFKEYANVLSDAD